MIPFLCSEDLSMENFLQLVRSYRFPDDALIMAFSLAKAIFEKYQYDEFFMKTSDQGRIFSPAGELKWRYADEKMRVVYLGNEKPPDGLQDYSHEIRDLTLRKEKEIILWGVRTDTEDEWIEQKVPHRFHYPLSSKEYACGRIALVTEDWIDAAGYAKFSRFHSLKEIRGEA